MEKSRAEYFRKRREDRKNFSVYVDKDKVEKLENKLKYQNLTKSQWLNDIIEEELTMDTIREIDCPYCGHEQSVNFSDEEVANIYSYDDRGMGTEVIYEANEENEIVCEECGEVYALKGYIREYPMGCLDDEKIETVKREEME